MLWHGSIGEKICSCTTLHPGPAPLPDRHKYTVKTKLPFDSIIACGDSFTEGCCDQININIEDTWPGQVAAHFRVPFVNLACGGASNYEIALQPISDPNCMHLECAPFRPLLIFAFTIDYRLPYYDFQLGRLQSCFSVLPEHLDRWPAGRDQKQHARQGFLPVRPCHIKQNPAAAQTGLCLDGYQFQTFQAIQTAMRWKKLIPTAKILWGFAHSDHADLPYDQHWEDNLQRHYGYKDHCFNEYLPGRCSLQNFSCSNHLWISANDCHPNKQGIDLYAKVMIDVMIKHFKL